MFTGRLQEDAINCVRYSDGSKKHSETGVGPSAMRTGESVTLNLGSHGTVFQVIATSTCAQIMVQGEWQHKRICTKHLHTIVLVDDSTCCEDDENSQNVLEECPDLGKTRLGYLGL